MARGAAVNGEGTLVDTIFYESTGVTLTDEARAALADDLTDVPPETTVGKVKVPVEIRLRKHFATDNGKDRPVGELQFSLVCRKPDLKFRGTDIEVLRAAMWSALDKNSAITWEAHLLITVQPTLSYGNSVDEGLLLKEETVWKGSTREGFHLLKRYGQGRLSSFDPVYETWPGAFTDKNGKVTACIPATADNQAAMDEFRRRIAELRKRLADLVRPNAILATLANLAGIALLAGPAEPNDETV